jgi:tRNA(Ile)-lysidine synthase
MNNDALLAKIISFIEDNELSFNKPVILGYSGGGDSTALFHLLMRLRKSYDIDLHIAHIDHGVREESKIEAQNLAYQAQSYNIPFHLKKLSAMANNNTENVMREKRYRFFLEVYQKIDAGAVILAHHNNDLAETVFKRVVEGASIINFYGMREVSSYDDIMTLWRPLLSISKKEIMQWLDANNIKYFSDKTNFDRSNMRSRMRCDVFPTIASSCGKNFENNLLVLSKKSWELNRYFDKKTKVLWDNRVTGPNGGYIDFADTSYDILEKYHVIHRFCKSYNIDIARKNIEKLVLWVDTKVVNKEINYKNYSIFVDRQKLIVHKNNISIDEEVINVAEGKFYATWGSVDITTKASTTEMMKGWYDVIKGEAVVSLPMGKYTISLPRNGSYYKGKRLKRWWSDANVPSFMRYITPVIYNSDNMVVQEMLLPYLSKEMPSQYFSCHFKFSHK